MPESGGAGITLRPATPQDCRRLWEWRNEPDSQRASFNTEPIPYERHEGWFRERMDDPDTLIHLILEAPGREVGYVRFQVSGDDAEISVCVDTGCRGKGYGPAAIRMASDRLLADRPSTRVIANVRRDNPASEAAFRRAGFAVARECRLRGIDAREMVYTGPGAPRD